MMYFKLLDLSEHNGTYFYDVTRKRADQGLVDGIQVRSSIGVRKDKLVDVHVAGIRDVVERPHGLYHYFTTAQKWMDQADAFSRVADRVGFRLRHWLDLEMIGNKPGVNFQADVLNWLAVVGKRFGHMPIIYSGPSFISTYLKLPDFALFDICIANYKVAAPYVPLPLSPDWLIWQYGQADGVFYGANKYLSKTVDVNVARELPLV